MRLKLILLIFILPILLFAQNFKYENIVQTLPNSFKLGFKNYNETTHTTLLEFVPSNETVYNWSKMITTIIYHRNINMSAKGYIQYMASLWKKKCQNSFIKILDDGKENGYSYALLMAYCPKNKITNKDEYTYFKAIKGNDSFYSVQKAFSSKPNKQEVINTMKYLKKVFVCDKRLNNCPKIDK
ncbi:hypothetical protein CPU12_02515 [Malaciobacter molluscorum LMG 25693]|uniref:Uncharacterized protein n=1 Tax=Malaciobacter molluscorum LMG 25693 TaxID=870501 RepID=A0A2G1DLB9_9BACT|nr:hypothetical protein [Malaciobacter molluscorum]AXX92721.1 hypothetical protein AMOL_1756 [Malaciobacter molluscorum LMG 25693]PHO19136.1 hypothetical protein CPU12_02515 [Malaciobacter molluscorum LMG 25693]RXJ97449.1 hypothetical protein CRV00_01040 [Malaciobacter molluscorum]